MRIGDLFDDPQADARSALCGRISSVEYLVALGLGDTGAGIRHLDPQNPVRRRREGFEWNRAYVCI
jgi:hypothetical protein